jgi:hypothetical protein
MWWSLSGGHWVCLASPSHSVIGLSCNHLVATHLQQTDSRKQGCSESEPARAWPCPGRLSWFKPTAPPHPSTHHTAPPTHPPTPPYDHTAPLLPPFAFAPGTHFSPFTTRHPPCSALGLTVRSWFSQQTRDHHPTTTLLPLLPPVPSFYTKHSLLSLHNWARPM